MVKRRVGSEDQGQNCLFGFDQVFGTPFRSEGAVHRKQVIQPVGALDDMAVTPFPAQVLEVTHVAIELALPVLQFRVSQGPNHVADLVTEIILDVIGADSGVFRDIMQQPGTYDGGVVFLFGELQQNQCGA